MTVDLSFHVKRIVFVNRKDVVYRVLDDGFSLQLIYENSCSVSFGSNSQFIRTEQQVVSHVSDHSLLLV